MKKELIIILRKMYGTRSNWRHDNAAELIINLINSQATNESENVIDNEQKEKSCNYNKIIGICYMTEDEYNNICNNK
jgi:hypothetical protein